MYQCWTPPTISIFCKECAWGHSRWDPPNQKHLWRMKQWVLQLSWTVASFCLKGYPVVPTRRIHCTNHSSRGCRANPCRISSKSIPEILKSQIQHFYKQVLLRVVISVYIYIYICVCVCVYMCLAINYQNSAFLFTFCVWCIFRTLVFRILCRSSVSQHFTNCAVTAKI